MTATRADPTMKFRLVGRWSHIPLQSDRERDHAIKSFVSAAFGASDELAKERAGMRRQIREAAATAEAAGGQAMFIATEIAPDLPMPVTMTVYASTDLRMSPSIGTESEQVIRTAEAALRALETPGIETVTSFVHPQSHVLRLHHFSDSAIMLPEEFVGVRELKSKDDLQSVTSLMVDYWIAVPGTKRTVLVNFFTPIIHMPHLMLALFDGIVQAAYFSEEDE